MTKMYEVRQVEGEMIGDNYYAVGYSLTRDGAMNLKTIAEKMVKETDDDTAKFEIVEFEMDEVLVEWKDWIEGM